MPNSKWLPPAHPNPLLANVYQASPFRPAMCCLYRQLSFPSHPSTASYCMLRAGRTVRRILFLQVPNPIAHLTINLIMAPPAITVINHSLKRLLSSSQCHMLAQATSRKAESFQCICIESRSSKDLEPHPSVSLLIWSVYPCLLTSAWHHPPPLFLALSC
jgi:hypothetical protein